MSDLAAAALLALLDALDDSALDRLVVRLVPPPVAKLAQAHRDVPLSVACTVKRAAQTTGHRPRPIRAALSRGELAAREASNDYPRWSCRACPSRQAKSQFATSQRCTRSTADDWPIPRTHTLPGPPHWK